MNNATADGITIFTTQEVQFIFWQACPSWRPWSRTLQHRIRQSGNKIRRRNGHGRETTRELWIYNQTSNRMHLDFMQHH